MTTDDYFDLLWAISLTKWATASAWDEPSSSQQLHRGDSPAAFPEGFLLTGGTKGSQLDMLLIDLFVILCSLGDTIDVPFWIGLGALSMDQMLHH